jgi:hypothetical protein
MRSSTGYARKSCGTSAALAETASPACRSRCAERVIAYSISPDAGAPQGSLGLYDQMGNPAGLLAPERDPQTGHRKSGVPGAKRRLARPGKRNRPEQEAPRKDQEAPQKAARIAPTLAAIDVAIAVVLAGAATALLSRAQSGPPITIPRVLCPCSRLLCPFPRSR